jgi:hypothetical protein
MVYRSLADLILLLHLAFVGFVVFGGLVVLRWPQLAFVHVPSVVWAVLLEYAQWTCPLTPLENTFRQWSGEAGYAGGFIEHYLTPVLYPPGLTHGIQVLAGSFVLLVNALAYWQLARRKHA